MKPIFLLFVLCTCVAHGMAHDLCPYQPGDTVCDSYLAQYGSETFFTDHAIPDSIFSFMQGRSYKAGCPIPRDSLRYLRCLHRDREGHTIVGEMVVNIAVAHRVLHILRQLYDARYPIERMRLIDYWDADDEASMRANNTSCFNYRVIKGTQKLSKHGQGLAIDINPLYNPYFRHTLGGEDIDLATLQPATAYPYVHRTQRFCYKIERGDLCYRLFTREGFEWGGDWHATKDYQHFEW